ncbi:hypothetical protein MP213Fo_27840 [Pseudochrobactrum sp. MP213Fo]
MKSILKFIMVFLSTTVMINNSYSAPPILDNYKFQKEAYRVQAQLECAGQIFRFKACVDRKMEVWIANHPAPVEHF